MAFTVAASSGRHSGARRHGSRRSDRGRHTGSAFRRNLVLSAVAITCTASLAVIGTYATFTSTVNGGPMNTASGTVTIALGATGAKTNRLNVNASGLVPGDTMQRTVDLINSGSQNLASITLTDTASPSTALDTDATNGLQVVVDACSVAWTEAGVSPAFTYTCGGSTSSVLASRAVIGSNIALSNLTTTTAGNTDHLRVTLTFPATADNTLQNLSSTFTFAFTGTQRAGSAH